MRRANGDWFAFDGHGRLCVPLFLSRHDALMSRLRNFEMLLFDPVAFDAQLLKEVAPADAGSNVDFCIVNDPFASLTRGSHLALAQVASLVDGPNALEASGNGSHQANLNHTSPE